jgi:hypothetical protein
MSAPNHYEVLGLPLTATSEEIEQRYQELSRLYGADGPQSGMVKLIEEARRILSNPTLRSVYDSGMAGAPASPAAAVTPVAPAVIPTSISPSPMPSVSAVAAGREVTQEWAPPSANERTIEVPPPVEPAPKPLTDDKKLAAELAKRGVASDEVQRMLAMGSAKPVTTGKKNKANLVSPPPIPPSAPYVPKPTITLPPFREATTQERMDADRQLTAANIARRRGQFKEAEKACRAALELMPKDAPALELYGDILQSVGQVDNALYSYERALEADPTRKTVEKKYAELMLLQNREIEMLRSEYIPRSPMVAVLFSAVLPGAGQLYNGEAFKGLLMVLASLGCIATILWTPYGLPRGRGVVPTSLYVFIVLFCLIYAYAVVDANNIARRGKKLKTGWEI